MATIFDTKRLQKYLFPSFEKENKYIYCRLRKLRHLQLVISSESCRVRRDASNFSAEEMDAIIFHEEYHQNNRDPLKLFCFTLLAEGMIYIPILKGLLQRYHVYQELAADKYAMRKMKSKFELGSALLKLIKIKTMENRCVTASFAKTAINLRIEQVLHEKVVKLNMPLHTNSVYVTVGLFCMSVVLIVGECI